ncbi:MAG: hypothetical protein V3S45_09850 [Kiloniellales bacterium]
MAIKFLSPHHSPDDPGGLIKEAISMGADFPGPAEDVILAWTLRLGVERDPAEVATRLLSAYGLTDGAPPEGACGRLVDLLRQAAASKGVTPCAPRRRRGRRRN